MLGQKVSQRGIKVDPYKMKALLTLQPQKIVEEVTSVIQKLKYLSYFIHLASKLLHPLQEISKPMEFTWTPTLAQYFVSIKEILALLSVIMPPCFEYPFYVNPSVGSNTTVANLL